jgi:hypothetical protein
MDDEILKDISIDLGRIAHWLERIANHGISVKQLSVDCMTGWHSEEPVDGCKGCGCACHNSIRSGH